MPACLPKFETALLIAAIASFTTPAWAETMPPASGLTNAAQIRSLTTSQAARAIPARLRGTVLDLASPPGFAVIIADETAGIYVIAATSLFQSWHRGDLVEVAGVTDPGQFAPIVKVSSARKVGTAPIPPPRPVSYQDLITGSLDAQWIEITGVVRRCINPTTTIWRVYIAANGGILSVRCSAPRDPQIQEDAEVRVQAICFYQFNQKRQVLTPVLQVPSGVPIQVIRPAPATPFAAPLRSADSLLQFAPDNPTGHRVHVHGIVTHAQSDSLWMRDGAAGLRIEGSQAETLKPGDEIEVLGFPAYGSASPMLEDALIKKTGVTPPPAPRSIANATNAFEFEDDLIAIPAVITDMQPVLEGTVLNLKSGGTVFKALLKSPQESKGAADWQPGSKVRVAGICSVVHDDVRPMMGVWQPQSFQLLMRSPADLTVISRPPWWTPQHVIFFLATMIGGLLLITGLVMSLARRRLNEQGHQRAMAEAEFSAILSERNRLAREIHDTLAQGLVATSVQLQLARKQSAGASDSLQHHLASAQQLVRSSLQDARNSIWNMRSQVLENGDLAGALKDILKQMSNGTEVKTGFEVAGETRRLAPVIESNLLRIGQEAITNAVRHAQARRIKVKLEFGEKQFHLLVRDDGRGFDPARTRPGAGGFGLVGMRERVAALAGDLTIRSTPGLGTDIQLTIPLAGE